jgi:hypothetical protein
LPVSFAPRARRSLGAYRIPLETGLLIPSDLFYKRSQEKNTSPVAGFVLAVQPTPLSKIVFAIRSLISGRYEQLCSALGFSTSGSHRFFATKPVSSETNKAERRSNGDHSSI